MLVDFGKRVYFIFYHYGLDFRSYSMHAKTRDDERRSSDTAFLIWSMVYLCRFHLLHSHDGYGFLVRVRDAFEMPGIGLDSEFATREEGWDGMRWKEMERCIWQS